MRFGNEVLLAACWGAGILLYLLAVRFAPIRRLLRGLRHPVPMPKPFAGKVFVIDGDTIHVRQERVRLFGMDAPELTQRGGFKARSHLIRLAGGKAVSVQPVDVDCYGRVVARVWLDGVDLSERMVLDGFARSMSDWHADYDAAEARARREQRGLWSGDPAGGIGDPAAHRRAQAMRTAPMAGRSTG